LAATLIGAKAIVQVESVADFVRAEPNKMSTTLEILKVRVNLDSCTYCSVLSIKFIEHSATKSLIYRVNALPIHETIRWVAVIFSLRISFF
jgi:hypothetical protein